MARFAFALLCCAPFAVCAANNDDDGFVWIDANTKIKVKPVSAASGASKAPQEEPKKTKKAEKTKK
jgi:hypothetical protein